MNKLLLITVLSFSALFLIGCQPDTNSFEQPTPPEDFQLANLADVEQATITTQNGQASYNVTINKPTPCYEVLVESVQQDQTTHVYFFVGQGPDAPEICPQVVDPQTFTDTVNTQEVKLYVNDQEINTTSD